MASVPAACDLCQAARAPGLPQQEAGSVGTSPAKPGFLGLCGSLFGTVSTIDLAQVGQEVISGTHQTKGLLETRT